MPLRGMDCREGDPPSRNGQCLPQHCAPPTPVSHLLTRMCRPHVAKRVAMRVMPAPFSLTAFGVNGPTLRFSVVGPLTHREAGEAV